MPTRADFHSHSTLSTVGAPIALLPIIKQKAAAEEPTGTALRGGAGRALAPVTETFPTPRYNGVRVDWCSGYVRLLCSASPCAKLCTCSHASHFARFHHSHSSYDQRVGPNDPAGFLGCGQGSADIFCRVRMRALGAGIVSRLTRVCVWVYVLTCIVTPLEHARPWATTRRAHLTRTSRSPSRPSTSSRYEQHAHIFLRTTCV